MHSGSCEARTSARLRLWSWWTSARRTGSFSPATAGSPSRLAEVPGSGRSPGSGRLAALGLGDCPGGVHEPNVAEGLREVAEQLARLGIDFLGQQPEIIAVTDGALEHLAGAPRLVRQRHGMGQPEGAQQEGSLPALQAVDPAAGVVPVDQ